MASVGDTFDAVLDRHYPRDPETGERLPPVPRPPVDFASLRQHRRPWWRFW